VEQRLCAEREAEVLLRWLPVALGLAVMYVPPYSALLEGTRQVDVHRLLGSRSS
jgi:hypothetical protein